MILSALIHKNKSRQVATLTVAATATLEAPEVGTVAKVATVTVASPPEQEPEGMFVTVYTPNGKTLAVYARDTEHAEWLQRMNPAPRLISNGQERI